MTFPAKILARLRASRIVAGFSVEKVEYAVPIANALLDGGIDAIELTLRTPAGLDAVKAICRDVPDMLVGVGTILSSDSVARVKATGADFGVAPGMNPRVVRSAHQAGLPFAPGIATPSDLEAAIEMECRFVKFFPAEASGGIKYLRSMSAPYQHLGIEYFPLGGLNEGNMLDYLRESHVPAIGGSWIVKKELVNKEDWGGLTAHAKEVVQKVKSEMTA